MVRNKRKVLTVNKNKATNASSRFCFRSLFNPLVTVRKSEDTNEGNHRISVVGRSLVLCDAFNSIQVPQFVVC